MPAIIVDQSEVNNLIDTLNNKSDSGHSHPGGPGGPTTWGNITGVLSNQTDLQTALDSKGTSNFSGSYPDLTNKPLLGTAAAFDATDFAGTFHNHSGVYENAGTVAAHEAAADPHPDYLTTAEGNAAYSLTTHNHSGTYEPSGAVAAHAAAADPHPGYLTPAEGNATYSPISHNHSASEINSGTMDTARLGSGVANNTTFLRGDQTWAPPAAGSDPWTYSVLSSDFNTSSATAVDTPLVFTPVANTKYIFECVLLTRTAGATTGPRPGVAWPSGGTDGIADIRQTSSASADVLQRGNISASVLAPVGGLPTTTGSWPASITGVFIAGASPSGTLRIQLASESAGTTVTAKVGSYLRWRSI